MELNCKKALMLLNDCKGMAKNDDWIAHSICVGDTAGIIAKSLNFDEDYAKTLGYDDKYAGICIKHSFLNNDINCLANDRDYTDSTNEKYGFIKEYILKEYTIYEKIINLCDLMCTTKLQTLEKRLIDLLLRHGVYKNTHYHLIEAHKLKENFDSLLGYNLYDLFPQIKDNL